MPYVVVAAFFERLDALTEIYQKSEQLSIWRPGGAKGTFDFLRETKSNVKGRRRALRGIPV